MDKKPDKKRKNKAQNSSSFWIKFLNATHNVESYCAGMRAGLVPRPFLLRKKRILLPCPSASALGSTHWHMRALR